MIPTEQWKKFRQREKEVKNVHKILKLQTFVSFFCKQKHKTHDDVGTWESPGKSAINVQHFCT